MEIYYYYYYYYYYTYFVVIQGSVILPTHHLSMFALWHKHRLLRPRFHQTSSAENND